MEIKDIIEIKDIVWVGIVVLMGVYIVRLKTKSRVEKKLPSKQVPEFESSSLIELPKATNQLPAKEVFLSNIDLFKHDLHKLNDGSFSGNEWTDNIIELNSRPSKRRFFRSHTCVIR